MNFSPEPGIIQKIGFDGGVGRLHLFAEPDAQPMCHDGHLQDAINEFDQLFEGRLDLSLMSTADCLGLNSDPIPDTCNAAGMLVCEERSLEELLNNVTCSNFSTGKTVQQQYADDKGSQKVQVAWSQLLADEKVPPDSDHEKLTQESKKFVERNRPLLYEGAKPPSNCMSMVCLNP